MLLSDGDHRPRRGVFPVEASIRRGWSNVESILADDDDAQTLFIGSTPTLWFDVLLTSSALFEARFCVVSISS